MATSSINHVFVVKDPKKANAFLESMEKSVNSPKFNCVATAKQLTNDKEIQEFLKRRKNKRNKNRFL